MAEPAPAKRIAAASHTITVSQTGNPSPLQTNADDADSIYFNVTGGQPCWIWTWDSDGNPANIFTNEQNDYLVCAAGLNGPYTFASGVDGEVWFQATAPNASQPPPPTIAKTKDVLIGVKGTIMITSSATSKK